MLVSWLVLAGSFHRVEHVLMALAAVFVAYIGAGLLAHPDWSEAFRGLVTPRMSFGHQETLIVAATVGTTLAPWGLSFIQSYAVDKKLTTKDLGYERTDVILGRRSRGSSASSSSSRAPGPCTGRGCTSTVPRMRPRHSSLWPATWPARSSRSG